MSEFFDAVAVSISALTVFDAVLYWALTLGMVLIGECYFARFGKQPRRFYKRIFDSLHWLIAIGPFVLCFALAAQLDGRSGEAIAVVFGFLSFFGTVHLLERFHLVAWKRFSQPSGQEQD